MTHTSTEQQPEALRLAEVLDALDVGSFKNSLLGKAAAELRRQHARIAELEAQLSAIGAGGVEPLRKRAAPAALAVPMAEAWEQSAADTEHQRTGAGLHFNQGIAEGLRICAKDLRAALAAPAHPSEGMPEQTSRDAVIQHLTSAGVLEHDGCGIFIASGDASELIDACMAISATNPTQQGLDAAVRELIDRLQDAQQDINLAANTHMSQQLASAAALLDEVESTLRALAATQPVVQGLDAGTQRNADIGAAIQRACKELPEGAVITISLERGAGMVEMFDWDGNEFDHFDEEHEDFACRINAATDGAIAAEQVAAQAKQGEQP